jgi:hypothetical protein
MGCASRPLTGAQAMRLEPNALKHRTLDLLADIMHPRPLGRRTSGPYNAHRLTSFRTSPHAGDLPNSCTMQGVDIAFEPVGAVEEAGPNTPMQAASIETDSYFLFLAPPGPDPGRAILGDEYNALQASCRRLSIDDPRFVHARDSWVAWEGVTFLREALAAIRAGNPQFEFACPDSASTCLELANAANLDYANVSPCGGGFGPADCFEIHTNIIIHIFLTGQGDQRRITRVAMGDIVIVVGG